MSKRKRFILILILILTITISFINIKSVCAVGYICKCDKDEYCEPYGSGKNMCRVYKIEEKYVCPNGYIQPNGSKNALCLINKEKICGKKADLVNGKCRSYKFDSKGAKVYFASTTPRIVCPDGSTSYDSTQCSKSGKLLKTTKTVKMYKSNVPKPKIKVSHFKNEKNPECKLADGCLNYDVEFYAMYSDYFGTSHAYSLPDEWYSRSDIHEIFDVWYSHRHNVDVLDVIEHASASYKGYSDNISYTDFIKGCKIGLKAFGMYEVWYSGNNDRSSDGNDYGYNIKEFIEIDLCKEALKEYYNKSFNKTNEKDSSSNKTNESDKSNKNTSLETSNEKAPKKSISKKVKIECLNGEEFSVDKGKSKTIAVKITNAKIKDATVESNDKKIATVSKTKDKKYIKVKGVKKGETKIKITVKGKSKTCKVKVNKKETQSKEENKAEDETNKGLTDISNKVDNTDTPNGDGTITNATIKTIKCPSKTPTVEVGKTKKISYKVNPSNASTNNVEFVVKGGSKDNIKITSKSPLKVKGLKKGTGKVVIKYNGKTTTCKVKVKKASKKESTKKNSNKKDDFDWEEMYPVKKVTISYAYTDIPMQTGEKRNLIANVSPAKANQKVTWKSSNKKIATIDSNGQVTAKSRGTVTITATSKNNSKIKATKKIKVTDLKANVIEGINVQSISISQTKSVGINERKVYKVTFEPFNASNKEIKWTTSDKSIVTVDSNGSIVGHKKGTATITAVSKNNKNAVATSIVTVTNKHEVKSVTVSPSKVTMQIGEIKTIQGIISPSTVTNKFITWKSSNNEIATVDSNGQITAKKKGTVTITATSRTDSTKKAKVKVTVKGTSTSSITSVENINVPETILLNVGNKTKFGDIPFNSLNYKILKTYTLDGVPYDKNVISIDSDGTIVGLKAGKAVVQLISKSNLNVTATTTIIVNKKINVSNILIQPEVSQIEIGENVPLSAVILPADASNQKVTWKSSNKKVATVKNGVVTGIKKGSVTITATSKSDKTKKATIKIKVASKTQMPTESEESNADTPTENDEELEWQTDENQNFNINLKVGESVYSPWNYDNFYIEDYTYVMTDDSIVTINDDFEITAVKVGTTSIKLISKLDSSVLPQMATINVIDNSTNSATSIIDSTSKKDIVKEKYSKYVYIGDSRFVGQKSNGFTDSNITYIAKVSKGLSYLKSNESKIKKYDSKTTAYVINLGVNDLGNKSKYTKYINSLAKNLKGDIYYLSVNPVDENKASNNGYKVKNSDITKFNSYLKKKLKSVKYLDSYSYLKKNGFKTTDGLHYTKSTYEKIYNYINDNVK